MAVLLFLGNFVKRTLYCGGGARGGKGTYLNGPWVFVFIDIHIF